MVDGSSRDAVEQGVAHERLDVERDDFPLVDVDPELGGVAQAHAAGSRHDVFADQLAAREGDGWGGVRLCGRTALGRGSGPLLRGDRADSHSHRSAPSDGRAPEPRWDARRSEALTRSDGDRV